MERWVQSWRPRTNAFGDFSNPPVYSTAPATKKWSQVIQSAAPVTQNHLSKPEDPRLQNGTLLRKSAPGPPHSSDEHVSCTAPDTENTSLQILFKCPTHAIVLGNATKPSPFAHLWQGPQSLAPATRNDIWTSKSGPTPWFFYILAWKCASRHNGVHFFDISTSKSGPELRCFVHFDLEMCFAPQRRALFRHLNFQKWSEHGVLCTFWLGNVLRATRACTFSTSQLPKVVRAWCALYILTSKCASHHNGVHFFDIATSKSGPTLLIFSLLLSSLLLALLSDSSHLCFSSVHIVGSLTSKLPSIIQHLRRYWIILFYLGRRFNFW